MDVLFPDPLIKCQIGLDFFRELNWIFLFVGSKAESADGLDSDPWELRRPYLKRTDYFMDLGLEYIPAGKFALTGPSGKVINEGTLFHHFDFFVDFHFVIVNFFLQFDLFCNQIDRFFSNCRVFSEFGNENVLSF